MTVSISITMGCFVFNKKHFCEMLSNLGNCLPCTPEGENLKIPFFRFLYLLLSLGLSWYIWVTFMGLKEAPWYCLIKYGVLTPLNLIVLLLLAFVWCSIAITLKGGFGFRGVTWKTAIIFKWWKPILKLSSLAFMQQITLY